MQVSNAVVEENQKPGNPESEWGLPNGASSAIQGYTTDISTNVGGVVDFKIDSVAAHYRIEIYRLGYYDGDGARLVASIEHDSSTRNGQPAPIVDLSTGLVDAGNWHITDSWQIPADAVSGVYIAKLVREDGVQGENQIPFIIRDDSSHSDIVFQTSDTTWQAYNPWGGSSLYYSSFNNPQLGNPTSNEPHRAYEVSYNRPLDTHTFEASIFSGEYAAIRWLEQNGYDVTYQSGIDTARNGDLLLNHQIFMDAGHDEYWIGEQRANVEAARDAGVSLAFLSGNEVYWHTRLEPGIDGSLNRTMAGYKESYQTGTDIDPSPEWTGQWRDPNSPDGANPENSLTGTLYMVNAYALGSIQVSSDFSQLRLWDNTSVANLQPGQTATLQNLLGYEWDIDADNGFRPVGLINLSSTTQTVPTLIDGNELHPTLGDATHSLNLYRAPSGALVFGAGTIFWAWGLDSHHVDYTKLGFEADIPVNPDVQQLMVNLLAEMGSQPGTLQPDLVPGVPTTDFTAPEATTIALSDLVVVGRSVVISGTSVDLGGGVVAGNEVSTDGGITWHKATGTGQWSYTWIPSQPGAVTVMARSVDDSLNLGSVRSLDVTVWNENLIGSQFDDQLYGNGGADVLTGLSGNDRLDGGSGSDWMIGGLGHDAYVVDNVADIVDETGGDGEDMVLSSISFSLADGVHAVGNVEHLRLTGTSSINGTGNSLANYIAGNAGDNVLAGLDGNDIIAGLDGNDRLDGGSGSDWMIGGLGHDAYVVDNVADIVDETGGDGEDMVLSSISFSLADGVHAVGNVEHLRLTGTSSINGTGNSLANYIAGNAGDNVLAGLDGNDIIAGLDGNDRLDGGSGSDWMIGGLGHDAYVVDNVADIVDETGGDGEDMVLSSISFSLADGVHAVGNVEHLRLTGTSSINGTGNSLANYIAGNAGDNVLAGLDGNDIIAGLDGNDRLDGGSGSDWMIGGLGHDAYVVDNVADIVDETGGDGEDMVLSSISFSLADGVHAVGNVEHLRLTGTSSINGTGNSLANYIAGNAGNNVLAGLDGNDIIAGLDGNDIIDGGNGSDTIIGGLGVDTLIGGAGSDRFLYLSAAEGGDIIQDFVISDDTLVFSASGFGGGLTDGQQLVAGVTFIADASPIATTEGTFLYDTTTNDLAWDVDGSGGIGAVQIAHFDTGVRLSVDHFDITA